MAEETLEAQFETLFAWARQGDYDQVLSGLEAVLYHSLSEQQKGVMLAFRAGALAGQSRDEEVEALLRHALYEVTHGPAFVLAAGTTLSDLGMNGIAVDVLKHLCELDSRSAIPPFNLGVVLGRAGHFNEAVMAYDAALALQPDMAQAVAHKSYCLQMLGDWEAAAETQQAFLVLAPEDPVEWLRLATLRADLGNLEAAYEAFGSARNRDPESMIVLFDWATTALRYEDVDRLAWCLEELEAVGRDDWRTVLVRSYHDELEGNAGAAWEGQKRAFDEAWQTGMREAAETALHSLLWFALRHGYEAQLTPFISLTYDQKFFSEGVLAALRALENRPSQKARLYMVTLKGGSDGAVTQCELHVVEECEADARATALAFETHCGATALNVVSVTEDEEEGEGLRGVYQRIVAA